MFSHVGMRKAEVYVNRQVDMFKDVLKNYIQSVKHINPSYLLGIKSKHINIRTETVSTQTSVETSVPGCARQDARKTLISASIVMNAILWKRAVLGWS